MPDDLHPTPDPEAPSARTTIRTVAEDAGVSVAAVSKVLRNAYGVSDGLRARVTASIEKLGYRPSKTAQRLRGRSTTVGVLLVEIGNPFLPQVIDGVQDVLAPLGYQAMLGVGRAQTHLETELIESMIDHGMAGLILIAPLLPPETVAHYARKTPIVVIATHEPTAITFDTVNGDDRRGGALAAQALIDRGYLDIGFLSLRGRSGTKPAVAIQREAGYQQTLTAVGLVPRIFDLSAPYDAHDAELAAFVASPDRPRAVVCWSDLDAIPLRGAASRAGLRVPEDLAIVGYDNTSMTASPVIELASVDQDGREQGRLAARTLLSRIDGRQEARHLLIEPHVVVRPSM